MFLTDLLQKQIETYLFKYCTFDKNLYINNLISSFHA